ncbi:MAG: hypothetical protein MUF20_14720, partial [Methylotetracoccus sp.]|nr:hypothetical protein [Methylotetracoccus sp.]
NTTAGAYVLTAVTAIGRKRKRDRMLPLHRSCGIHVPAVGRQCLKPRWPLAGSAPPAFVEDLPGAERPRGLFPPLADSA